MTRLLESFEREKLEPPLWTGGFATLLLGNFAVLSSLMVVMTVLPVYLQDLGYTTATIGLIVALFNLAGTSIRVFVGREMDRHGVRWILFGGVVLFSLANLTYVVAVDLSSLLWLRTLHGLTWGVVNTAATVAVIDAIPKARRGEGLNIYSISAGLPTAFMPWLALYLVEVVSFPFVFMFAFVLPTLGAFALLRASSGESVSLAGPPPVLVDPLTLVPGLGALAAGMTFGAVTTLAPLYLANLGSMGAGLFFLLFTVAVTLSRFFLRRVYDRYGLMPFLIYSPPAIAVGLLLLSLQAAVGFIAAAALLYGAGFGVLKPAIQAWSVDRAPASRRAAANAMFYSGFEFGVAAGAVIFGFVASVADYSAAFRIVAFVPLLMLVPCYLTLRKDLAS